MNGWAGPETLLSLYGRRAHSWESTHSTSETATHSVVLSAHSTLMALKSVLLTAITTPYSSPRRTTAPTLAALGSYDLYSLAYGW